MAADYVNDALNEEEEGTVMNPRNKRRSISINITEEALRRGKLPTELVARNMAQNKYNERGMLRA